MVRDPCGDVRVGMVRRMMREDRPCRCAACSDPLLNQPLGVLLHPGQRLWQMHLGRHCRSSRLGSFVPSLARKPPLCAASSVSPASADASPAPLASQCAHAAPDGPPTPISRSRRARPPAANSEKAENVVARSRPIAMRRSMLRKVLARKARAREPGPGNARRTSYRDKSSCARDRSRANNSCLATRAGTGSTPLALMWWFSDSPIVVPVPPQQPANAVSCFARGSEHTRLYPRNSSRKSHMCEFVCFHICIMCGNVRAPRIAGRKQTVLTSLQEAVREMRSCSIGLVRSK